MKKLLLIFIGTILLVNTVGCQRVNTDDMNNTANTNETSAQYIKSVKQKPDYTALSVVNEFTGGIISDSSDDSLILYTDAERDKDGVFVKNDNNRWVLSVCDSATGEYYTLFDDTIHAGDIYFQVVDFFEEGKPFTKILLYKNSSAELMINSFSFEAGKGFSMEKIYNTSDYSDSGINLRFSTVPSY